jgi:hypothetical protein
MKNEASLTTWRQAAPIGAVSMTRFGGAPRLVAIGVFIAVLGLMVWGWFTTSSFPVWLMGMRGAEDLELYRLIVEHIQQGRNYYDAAALGLAERNFDPKSTFNWRLPTCATVIGLSDNPEIFFWLLKALSLVSVVTAVRTFLMPACGTAGIIVGALLLLGGAFSWSIYEPDSFLATEPWCEALILLSLSAYARGWWPAGMTAAVIALSLRELMLPYCLVALALAIKERRRTEWLLWLVCLGLFGLFLYWHNHAIALRRPNVDSADIEYWRHFTGLRFILQTCQMNVLLRMAPCWLIAIYFPIALVGLASWPGRIGVRLTLSAGIYIAAFAFLDAGVYWGYFYAPILELGFVRSPAAFRDLWQAATRKQAPVGWTVHPTGGT